MNSRKLKAIIRISASVRAMRRSLCRPRTWPPRLTAYSLGRPRRERVLVVLQLAPFFRCRARSSMCNRLMPRCDSRWSPAAIGGQSNLHFRLWRHIPEVPPWSGSVQKLKRCFPALTAFRTAFVQRGVEFRCTYLLRTPRNSPPHRCAFVCRHLVEQAPIPPQFGDAGDELENQRDCPFATGGRSASLLTVFLPTCSPPLSTNTARATAISAPMMAPSFPFRALLSVIITSDIPDFIRPTPAPDGGSCAARTRRELRQPCGARCKRARNHPRFFFGGRRRAARSARRQSCRRRSEAGGRGEEWGAEGRRVNPKSKSRQQPASLSNNFFGSTGTRSGTARPFPLWRLRMRPGCGAHRSTRAIIIGEER